MLPGSRQGRSVQAFGTLLEDVALALQKGGRSASRGQRTLWKKTTNDGGPLVQGSCGHRGAVHRVKTSHLRGYPTPARASNRKENKGRGPRKKLTRELSNSTVSYKRSEHRSYNLLLAEVKAF